MEGKRTKSITVHLEELALKSCKTLFSEIDSIVNSGVVGNKSSIGDYSHMTPNNASNTMLVEHSHQIINLKAPAQFEKVRAHEESTLNPNRKLSQTSQLNNISEGRSPKRQRLKKKSSKSQVINKNKNDKTQYTSSCSYFGSRMHDKITEFNKQHAFVQNNPGYQQYNKHEGDQVFSDNSQLSS